MTDTAATFNLVDEPWIVVHSAGGAEHATSLGSVLADAHELRCIGGDIPTQTFAIMRVLLAIVRRAFGWGDDPIARWVQIWQEGRFPADELADYLASVRHRFDLLDPAEPFYQVADLATAKGEFKPIELLLVDVPTGEKYFTTRAGSGTESLSFAEAARWLVHCQCYDISGIKSADARDPRGKNGKGYPIGVGWCGQLGGVIFEGGNLFQTLMLNTVLQTSDDSSALHDGDLPVWERSHPDHRQRESLTPTGPADLLTWQSRRIRLIANGARIVKVLVANGDPLESHNRLNVEFMTGWRFSEAQTKKFGHDRFLPLQWSADRALWRGIEGLVGDVPDASGERMRFKPSTTARWLKSLLADRHLDPESFVRPHAYGLTYINQASVVGAGIDDALLMRIALLSTESAMRDTARAAVNCATDAVRALGTLAVRLAQAGGGTGEGVRQAAEAAAYFALDDEYRSWLRELRGDVDDPAAPITNWQHTVRDIIRSEGARLIEDAGQPAWLGREINAQWIDTPSAEAMFRGSLRKALPYAYQPEPAI